MTEADIIHQITLGCPKSPKRFGVGDDAALVGNDRVVSQDTMVEGIHWDEKLTANDVGWKIVAVNASDIAAMGGRPEWATLSISVPPNITEEWIREFSSGMRAALRKWDILLVGGDTTSSPGPIIVSMHICSLRQMSWAFQCNAKVQDDIWVTGTLGDAAVGFYEPNKFPHNDALQRPNPPVNFANHIQKIGGIHSMTDISDGLYKDLSRLCSQSNVGAIVDAKKFPASSLLHKNKSALSYQTAFGEDYEMLFTAKPTFETLLRRQAAKYRVTISKIGKITESLDVQLRDEDWPKPLFEHFKK